MDLYFCEYPTPFTQLNFINISYEMPDVLHKKCVEKMNFLWISVSFFSIQEFQFYPKKKLSLLSINVQRKLMIKEKVKKIENSFWDRLENEKGKSR